MSQGYQIINQSSIHYMTFQVVDWVDVFSRQSYRDIILDSFRYSQKEKGLWLYSYVIMSNHIHLIAASKDGKLSDLVRDINRTGVPEVYCFKDSKCYQNRTRK